MLYVTVRVGQSLKPLSIADALASLRKRLHSNPLVVVDGWPKSATSRCTSPPHCKPPLHHPRGSVVLVTGRVVLCVSLPASACVCHGASQVPTVHHDCDSRRR